MTQHYHMPPYMPQFDAVVVASGDYPTHHLPLAIVEQAKMLVACDSAGEYLIKEQGIVPHAIVGDCDSMTPQFRKQYASIIHHVAEQDYNDLTKATRHCVSLGAKTIAYIACTGKREDHTLGNIALMHFFWRKLGVKAVMITDYGTFLTASGSTTFSTFEGQQVSIINMGCHTLSGEGLRWQPYAYEAMWQGMLNEAIGTSITLTGDADYMVYLTHL